MSGMGEIGEVEFDDLDIRAEINQAQKVVVWYPVDPLDAESAACLDLTFLYGERPPLVEVVSDGEHIVGLTISPARAREWARMLTEAADGADAEYRTRTGA
jgi:hypothetical protein